MRRQLVPALRMLVVLTVVLGLALPARHDRRRPGRSSRHRPTARSIERDGEVVGSALVGQTFSGAEYFHTRPSAAGSLAAGALVQDVDDAGNPVGDPHPADPRDLSLAASGASNQGPTNPDLLAAIEERAAAYREMNGLEGDVPVPIDAVTASGSGRRSPHLDGQRPAAGERVASERGLDLAAVQRLVERPLDERSLGFLGEEGVTSSSSTSPSTSSTTERPYPETDDGVSCASTSVRPPAWARRSPCSTRDAGAPSAAPTSSSATSRPTAGPTPRPRSVTSRSSPVGRVEHRGATLRGDGHRRRARPAPRGRAGRRAGPHQRPRLAATPSAGRTSRSSSTPASTSSRPSTSSTSSRSTTWSSGSPA